MARKFSKLSRLNIRSLEKGEKLSELGITVECQKSGDIRYSINIMVDGERVHRVIGRESEGVTRTQCEEFIESARTDAREGRLSLPKGRKTALSFRKAATEYIARLESTGGKNLVAKTRHMKLRLKPFFANQRPDKITSFTVDRYKQRRKGEGAGNGTINRELATLSHFFSCAVDWGWIKQKPCKITKLEESAGRIIALSDEEVSALVESAIADEDPDCWLFVLFGLNTAMRHSEILRARFDQLDLDNLRLFIPDAKSGQREQPITLELAKILEQEREGRDDQDSWIFASPRPNASGTGYRYRMGASFRRAVIRAGLDAEKITPHVMRHTAITKLVQAGVDLPTIQKISGHKTLSMVLRYAHVHGRHINAAISVLGHGANETKLDETMNTVTPKLHTVA
jgi:integrase